MAEPITKIITIDSILGGQNKYENFAEADQFTHSYGIDPDLKGVHGQSEGNITPSLLKAISAGFGPISVRNAPLWIITNPKDTSIRVYDYGGSIYTISLVDFTFSSETSVVTEGGTAHGNGATYYNNYIYYAKDTTIARQGPLGGGSSVAHEIYDYWSSTLAKTALSNTSYPEYLKTALNIPNHVMLRHNDGKLYFADVVGNQGTLHYIKTTKGTVEGDTDDGSTYNALDFPYGMWPTALASYGTDIAVALYEGSAGSTAGLGIRQSRAKLAFWDTLSPNYKLITEVEFPDPIIYALLNSNGILYTFSGEISGETQSGANDGLRPGVRICRFTGGYTFEQVAYLDYAFPPLAGSVEGNLNRILFGSGTIQPDFKDSDGSQIPANYYRSACVWGIGSKQSPISSDVFSVSGCTETSLSSVITAIKLATQDGMDTIRPLTGWINSGNTLHGVDIQVESTDDFVSSRNTSSGWRSAVYKVGQPFKIKKIRIPFSNLFTSTMGLTVGVSVDSFNGGTEYFRAGDFIGTSSGMKSLTVRPPQTITGEHRFVLELIFTKSSSGSDFAHIGFPITIELELYDE